MTILQSGRKGASAGGTGAAKAAPAPVLETAVAKAVILEAPAPAVAVTETRLGAQISIPKKNKGSSGATFTKSVSLLKPETLEYLYFTNGYIFRGTEQTAAAIVRNGYEIIASNATDQKICDEFVKRNRLDSRLLNVCRNTALFGNSYWELYDSDDGIRIAELPPSEIVFKKDTMGYIIYNPDTGHPIGYQQTRQSATLAEWDSDLIVHFKFLELGASDIGISMIQSAVFACTEFGIIRQNVADSFIRSLNVAHVAIEGGTALDIEEASDRLSRQFTAESVYVTSERYSMSNLSNVGNNVVPANFIEPTISEIAAAFSIPVELIASTSTFTLTDFETRYAEWLEIIKEKQRLIAETLEVQVFGRFIAAPVTVKFNSPNPTDVNNLMKNLGFAVQSQAITAEQSQKILEKVDVFPEV